MFWLRCDVWTLSEKYDGSFIFNKGEIDAKTPDIHGRKREKGENGICGSGRKQLAVLGRFQGVENMENTPLCYIVGICNIENIYNIVTWKLYNVYKKQLFFIFRYKVPDHITLYKCIATQTTTKHKTNHFLTCKKIVLTSALLWCSIVYVARLQQKISVYYTENK